jgi:hypothetical protein
MRKPLCLCARAFFVLVAVRVAVGAVIVAVRVAVGAVLVAVLMAVGAVLIAVMRAVLVAVMGAVGAVLVAEGALLVPVACNHPFAATTLSGGPALNDIMERLQQTSAPCALYL